MPSEVKLLFDRLSNLIEVRAGEVEEEGVHLGQLCIYRAFSTIRFSGLHGAIMKPDAPAVLPREMN
jgi:hypothetical protein